MFAGGKTSGGLGQVTSRHGHAVGESSDEQHCSATRSELEGPDRPLISRHGLRAGQSFPGNSRAVYRGNWQVASSTHVQSPGMPGRWLKTTIIIDCKCHTACKCTKLLDISACIVPRKHIHLIHNKYEMRWDDSMSPSLTFSYG